MLILVLILIVKDKNHKDINMKNNTILFLMYSLMSIVWLAFLVLAASNIANAQTKFYASCESPNEIILQKKACERRFNDCLPLPKFDHNYFRLKCIEEEYEDKSKPIYAKDCPEGEISHNETICEAPEFLAENQEENCYNLEVMCEPESYGMSTRMVLVEDVELVQYEKAQIQAQREVEARRSSIIKMLSEELDDEELTEQELRQRLRDIAKGQGNADRE